MVLKIGFPAIAGGLEVQKGKSVMTYIQFYINTVYIVTDE